jgi:hypothetical protein
MYLLPKTWIVRRRRLKFPQKDACEVGTVYFLRVLDLRFYVLSYACMAVHYYAHVCDCHIRDYALV